jgi:hypothetical protein
MKFVVQVAAGRVEHDLAVAPKAPGLEMGQSPRDIDPRQALENGRREVPGVTVFASPRVACPAWNRKLQPSGPESRRED